jgi:hypothetical protein
VIGGRLRKGRENGQRAERVYIVVQAARGRHAQIGTLNVQNQPPYKTEVHTSSFCSIWFGVDQDTCKPDRPSGAKTSSPLRQILGLPLQSFSASLF